MGEMVQEPRVSGSRRGRAGVGDRVHQVLNLAAALAHASTPDRPSSSAAATSAPSDAAGSDAAGSDAAGEAVFVGTPLGVEVTGLTDTECVGWAQDLEALSRFVQALQVQAAGELGRRKEAGRFQESGVRGPVELLVQGLRVGAAEAARRLRLARAVIPATDTFTGELMSGAHPGLGEAFCAGYISQENALLVASALDDAGRLCKDERISADTFQDVSQLLVEAGRNEAPDHVRRINARVLSHLDPDGQKPSTRDLVAKQGLFFRQARRGLIHFDGHMTIAQYEQLMVAIGTATNPNKHTDINTINQPDTTTGSANSAGGADNDSAYSASGADESDEASEATGGASRVDGQGALLDQIGGLVHIFNTATGAEATTPAEKDLPELSGTSPEPDPPDPEPLNPVPPESSAPGRDVKDDFWPTDDPAGESAGYRPPAMLNGNLVRWGGTRRLEEWEIPPRPEGAPPNAMPPRFESEKWFWLPPEPAEQNITTETGDPGDTNGDYGDGGPGVTNPDATNNDDDDDDDDGSDWGGLGVGDGNGNDPEEGQGPWLVDGTQVPHPGSGETLDGLDRRDPQATDPVTLDRRSYGQKLLDGLLDCVKLAARTGTMPINGGLKTQLIITTSQADLDRTDGAGTLFTTHTGPVPLSLFAAELCDAETTKLFYGQGQNILDVGRTQRLFTTQQRKIIAARDLGCSFPDCTAPATWCEAHHIIPWHNGGATDINNAALLCSYHHTLLHHSDWSMTLTNGTPYFTAPYAIDHTQTPRRNNYHHGLRGR